MNDDAPKRIVEVRFNKIESEKKSTKRKYHDVVRWEEDKNPDEWQKILTFVKRRVLKISNSSSRLIAVTPEKRIPMERPFFVARGETIVLVHSDGRCNLPWIAKSQESYENEEVAIRQAGRLMLVR